MVIHVFVVLLCVYKGVTLLTFRLVQHISAGRGYELPLFLFISFDNGGGGIVAAAAVTTTTTTITAAAAVSQKLLCAYF